MKFSDYIHDIEKFYTSMGVDIEPLPEVKMNSIEQDRLDPFIKTGYYEPETRTIVLFTHNRHLKDILRSFCHELIHHNQNITDPAGFSNANVAGALRDNDELEMIEGDAYIRGNLMFRRWTEQFTM